MRSRRCTPALFNRLPTRCFLGDWIHRLCMALRQAVTFPTPRPDHSVTWGVATKYQGSVTMTSNADIEQPESSIWPRRGDRSRTTYSCVFSPYSPGSMQGLRPFWFAGLSGLRKNVGSKPQQPAISTPDPGVACLRSAANSRVLQSPISEARGPYYLLPTRTSNN